MYGQSAKLFRTDIIPTGTEKKKLTAKKKAKYRQVLAIVSPSMATRRNPQIIAEGDFFACACVLRLER